MEETLKREKDQKERKFLLTTNVSRKNEHVVFFEVAVGVTDKDNINRFILYPPKS